jgi:hypothetical protein
VPFVAQSPRNDLNGQGTVFVESAGDLAGLRDLGGAQGRVKITEYVPGFSINTTACVTRHGVARAWCFRQLVGVPELTAVRGAHCGNDTSVAEALPTSISAAAYEATDRIGGVLFARGYRGAFGVDFVVGAGGAPHVVEINPRLQSTSSLVNALQVRAGIPPLTLLHVLEHARAEYRLDIRAYNSASQARPPNDAAQCVIFHRGAPAVLEGAMTPGLYRLDDGFTARRDGLSLLDARDDGDVLVTRRPAVGAPVARHAMLHVVQALRSCVDAGGTLSEWAHAACALVRDRCRLADVAQEPSGSAS